MNVVCRAVSCAALLASVLLYPATAQNTASFGLLTEFCGVKAGEKKQGMKVRQGDDLYPRTVRCPKPFRKFRNARLNFSEDDKLIGISAITFIERMTPNAGKFELDSCCAELAKSGIRFPEKWNDVERNGRFLRKTGTGPGVASVEIQGDLQASRYDDEDQKQTGILITIDLTWSFAPVFTPKTAPYNPQGGLSRLKFVENALGVTFGEKAPVPFAQVSPPLLGMSSLLLQLPGNGQEELKVLSLSGRRAKSKRPMEQKREYIAFCNEIGNWLKLTPPFEHGEKRSCHDDFRG